MNNGTANEEKRIVLGKIGKAHGIKGWVKLQSFTAPPENILQYSSLRAELGAETRTLLVDDSKQQSNGLLVHIQGIDDPEAAQTLTGTEVWVHNSELPELEQGDFYWHELENMLVWNTDKQLLGRVSKLLETGANDVLVVTATSDSIDDRERLVPYIKDVVVLEVDIEANRILLNWDATYLD